MRCCCTQHLHFFSADGQSSSRSTENAALFSFLPEKSVKVQFIGQHLHYHKNKKNLVSFEFAQDNEKNKYLILSKKGVEVFNIHKEQQEHIEKAIFSVLRNYSEEDLQMVMKLLDDVEQVWRELPWKKSR